MLFELKKLMSANRHLALGVDTTLLKTHFAVVTDAVGELRFLGSLPIFRPLSILCDPSLLFLVASHRLFYHRLPFCLWGIWILGWTWPYLSPLPLGCLGLTVPTFLQRIFPKLSSLGHWSGPFIPGQIQKFDRLLNLIRGFFGIVMSMHTVDGVFIASWY